MFSFVTLARAYWQSVFTEIAVCPSRIGPFFLSPLYLLLESLISTLFRSELFKFV